MKRVFFVLILFLFAIALPFWGAEGIVLSDLSDPSSVSHRIFFDLRVPRLLLLFSVGGALALLGGTYQTLFHNPLAEPYVLGISSAVTLGAVISEVFFHAPAHSPVGFTVTFLMALLATALLFLMVLTKFGRYPERIVLFGMGMNFLFSSILFLFLSYYSQQMGSGSMRWLFGQIPWVSMKEAGIFAAISLPFVALILIYGRHLDALSMGDGVARTMGISPNGTRNILLVGTSLFVAFMVSLTGAIGFVGLVVPHAARLILRPSSTRELLCFSFLLGAIFLGFADASSRILLPPFEFPIGVFTTVIGAPPFLYLLWKR
jgi:iron complex transport system permease protein